MKEFVIECTENKEIEKQNTILMAIKIIGIRMP